MLRCWPRGCGRSGLATTRTVGESRARATAVELVRSVPAWVWVAALVVLSTGIRYVLARRAVAPWIMVDELIYSELAKSFAGSGHFLVREHATAAGLSGAHAFDRDLGPAAWRGAEIDDARARPQQPEPIVQLDQLEGGARTETAALRFRDIGIGELPLQPTAGGCRALLAVLQPAAARAPGNHRRPGPDRAARGFASRAITGAASCDAAPPLLRSSCAMPMHKPRRS